MHVSEQLQLTQTFPISSGGGEGGFWYKVLNVVGTSDLAWRPVIDSPWKAVIYWVNVCAWVKTVPAAAEQTKPEQVVVSDGPSSPLRTVDQVV